MGFQYFGQNNVCNDPTKNKCPANHVGVQRVGNIKLSLIWLRYLITDEIIPIKWSVNRQ